MATSGLPVRTQCMAEHSNCTQLNSIKKYRDVCLPQTHNTPSVVRPAWGVGIYFVTGWLSHCAGNYAHKVQKKRSSRVISADRVSCEPSALWLVAATANWVASQRTAEFALSATKYVQCTQFKWNEFSWDEMTWDEMSAWTPLKPTYL